MLAVPVGSGCRSAPLAAPGSVTPAWGVAAEELGRQYLFRVEAEARGETAALRLTLRLWRPERFELRATDAFGRAAWRLEVAGDDGVWSGGRGDERCRLGSARPIDLAMLRLPLSPAAWPALLLGRLPFAPHPAAPLPVSGEAQFLDARGRSWWVRLAAGRPEGWRVHVDAETTVEWRREGAQAELVSAHEGLALRWRETRREPLRGAEPAWTLDPDLPECSDADLS